MGQNLGSMQLLDNVYALKYLVSVRTRLLVFDFLQTPCLISSENLKQI